MTTQMHSRSQPLKTPNSPGWYPDPQHVSELHPPRWCTTSPVMGVT